LIACALLCAFWVRSYWRWDYWDDLRHGIAVHSASGQLQVATAQGPFLARESEIGTIAIKPRGLSIRSDFASGVIDLPRGLAFGIPTTWTCLWMEYWIPTYLFGVLAIAPWIPWPPRFQLRSLLIVMTAITLLIAIAVVSLPPGAR
jgi:hypothetical protein